MCCGSWGRKESDTTFTFYYGLQRLLVFSFSVNQFILPEKGVLR